MSYAICSYILLLLVHKGELFPQAESIVRGFYRRRNFTSGHRGTFSGSWHVSTAGITIWIWSWGSFSAQIKSLLRGYYSWMDWNFLRQGLLRYGAVELALVECPQCSFQRDERIRPADRHNATDTVQALLSSLFSLLNHGMPTSNLNWYNNANYMLMLIANIIEPQREKMWQNWSYRMITFPS